jgi:hypothetical protein
MVRVFVVAMVAACSGGRDAPPPPPAGRDAPAAPVAIVIDAPPPPPDAAVMTPERAAVLDAVDALADAVIAARGCPGKVMNRAFRSAPILCLGATAAAVTSAALEDPVRAPAAATRVDALIALALGPAAQKAFKVPGSTDVGGVPLPRSVLYRGVLGLMHGGLERLSPRGARTPMFDAIALSLAADLSIGLGWRPTYKPDEIWPCDHAPAVSALRLHALLRGNAATERGADALAIRLRDALRRDGGFPTKLDAKGGAVDATPRGSTLAFTAAFLSPGQPQLADAFATVLVETRCEHVAGDAVACREWTPADKRKADAASGPIIKGYATGATALALVATRALDDASWNTGLLLTARAAGGGALDPAKRPLEVALLLWGQTARSWK